MFENTEFFKIESVVHKQSKKEGFVKERTFHGFNIRCSGSMEYQFENEKITVKAGELIFVPKGSQYQYFSPDEDRLVTIINVSADIQNPKARVFSLENFYESEYISTHFADLFRLGTNSEKYKCLSLFYSLLSYISNVDSVNYSDRKKSEIISPAVKFLNENIYNPNLKTENLHKICGVSDTYFRKIFIKNFGTSPKDYTIRKRISHAKAIIDSGEAESIQDLALSVGYTDPLYFGKVFKKFYGMSPSKLI